MSIATDGFGTLFEGTEGLIGDPTALTQAAWWIDPANSTGVASNSNPGTLLLPLLTFAELRRRWVVASGGGNVVTFADHAVIEVTYLSAPPSINADPIVDNLVFVLTGDARIDFIGFLGTATRTSTLTSVTARAATQCWNFVDSTVTTWESNVMIQDSVNNAISWMSKDLGSHTALVTEPFAKITQSATGAVDAAHLHPALPTAPSTDAYSVSKPCRVRLGPFEVRGRSGDGLFVTSGVTFINFSFGVDVAAPANNTNAEVSGLRGDWTGENSKLHVVFTQCLFEGPLKVFGVLIDFVNCFFVGPLNLVFGQASFIAGGAGSNSTISGMGGAFILDGYFLVNYNGAGGVGVINDTTAGISKFPVTFFIESVASGPNVTDLFYAQNKASILGIQSGFYFGGNAQVIGTCTHVFRISNGARASMTVGTWSGAFLLSFTKFVLADHSLTTLFTYSPTTGLPSAGPSDVTPALMDTSVGGGGYGGQAYVPFTGTGLQPSAQ